MEDIITIHPNVEFYLDVVAYRYPQDADQYASQVQWEITELGSNVVEKIGTGSSIKYKVDKKYAGKTVVFRAYIDKEEGEQFEDQNLRCKVDSKIYITDLNGHEQAKAGEVVEYRVSEYKKDESQISPEKVPEELKKTIKWKYRLGSGEYKNLLKSSTNEPFMTEHIRFTVPEAWNGKVVTLFPYLVGPKSDVFAQLTVENTCSYVNVKGVAEYIVREMLTNINSPTCIRIKQYNHDFWRGSPFRVIENKRGAYRLWKSVVGARCVWDHKQTIRDNYREWSCNKNDEQSLKFNYDIWSNVHYGFVGKHAGFMELELLNGAGYAQIGDNNKSLTSWETWRQYFANRVVDLGDADILGGFDDPKDQQAIKIGFELYDEHKDNLTADILIEKLIERYNNGKPINIERCEQH